MNALIFLAIPIVIVAVGAVALWFRQRNPTSVESGVDAFRREMNALSPESPAGTHRRGSGASGRR